MGDLFFHPEAAVGGFVHSPPITGQTAPSVSGDDGSQFAAGDYVGGILLDGYNLASPNPKFPNHSKRFTGDTGGYMDDTDGTFKDKDNAGTTEALAFPNDIVRDYKSLRRYSRNSTGNVQWVSGIAALIIATQGGETGWFPANKEDLDNLSIHGGIHTNYIDERILPNVAAKNLWSSTDDKNDLGDAFQFVGSTGQSSSLLKTNTRALVYAKNFLITD